MLYLFVDVKTVITEWPPLVQESAPVMTQYTFPDWAIGLVLAGGILFVFVILVGIVMVTIINTDFYSPKQYKLFFNP